MAACAADVVIKPANNIIENLTQKLELITEAVEFIRAKVDGLTQNMGVVSNMVGSLVDKVVVKKLSGVLEDRIKSTPKKKRPSRKRVVKKKK